MNSPKESGGKPPALRPSHRSTDSVTAGLQRMFASIADEPIPDDFLRLLDSIDAGGNGSIGGGTSEQAAASATSMERSTGDNPAEGNRT